MIHQNSQVSADFMTQESSTIKIFHCFWIIKDFSLRFIFNRQNSKYIGNGKSLRACLHGGGGPHIGKVTQIHAGGVTRLSI